MPPLGREVPLPASDEHPILLIADLFVTVQLLVVGQVNIATKLADGNLEPEAVLEVELEPVDKVHAALVRLVEDRVVHGDDIVHLLAHGDLGDPRVVEPDRGVSRPHVYLVLTCEPTHQVTHGAGQHDLISRRVVGLEDDLHHSLHCTFGLV